MLHHAAIQRRYLLGIFVVSGFTGLIYESIWSQYLKLFLGHAAYAQTVVLSIFMGGMALGSWLVARYGARLRELLWGYLLVEALIGVMGLVFHRVFVAATDLSFAHVIPVLPSGAAIQAYKWSLAALLVLPQSVLLGATFPLISGGIIRRWPERAGETLSILYFTNSLGAAIGVLVSGFVLIALVGLPGTIMTAGLLNIVLALGVWLIARQPAEPVPVGTAGAAPSASAAAGHLPPLSRWLVTAAFLTGVASFLYELGWIRLLSLVLGSSTHSFELMLSAFIFGLAFGGLYVRSRIEHLADAAAYLGKIMLAMGTLAALTLPAGNAMFEVMAWAYNSFARTTGGYPAFNIASQGIAMLIMLPTTFCAGMTLPVLTRALMRQGLGERAIGMIYSLNTLGSIVGVLLAVHVLMPTIGIKGVILTGAAIHIGLGLSRLAPRGLRDPVGAALVAVSVVALGLTLLLAHLDPRRVGSAVYRTGVAELPADSEMLYLRDGKTSTVSLAELHGRVWIATNGKTDAAIQMEPGAPTPDEATMTLLAAIPLSLHTQAVRVANIGFGSGLTSRLLLADPHLERLDTIEIEPRMVQAARLGFGPRIHEVFEDPRSHIVIDDAKTFFAAAREPYDLILSEPSNPWVSGVASLFSDEFYDRIVTYLRPDGYFAQWIQVYETDLGIVASISKAVSRHFGAYAIYNLNDSDIMILATRARSFPAPSDQVFQWPALRADLDRIGAVSTSDFERRRIGDGHILDPLFRTAPVPANSDYFPFVDLNAMRLRYMEANAFELPSLIESNAPFLEVLRAQTPAIATVAPGEHSALVRDLKLRRALAVQRALSTGRLENIDADAASAVLLIDLPAKSCADRDVRAAWSIAVRRISDATAAYLSPSELAPLWTRIEASPCYRDAPGEHRTWVGLFAAVAARNASQIVTLGTQLLQSPATSSADDLTYLTLVMAPAYIALGQPSQAHALLASQWQRLDRSRDNALPLSLLLAVTRPPNAR